MIRKIMLFFVVLVFMGYACIEQKDGYLVKVYDEAHDQIGVNTAYVNQAGDTVIPFGKYYYCFTDTFRDFAIVIDHKEGCVGIDRDENILYQVHWFDNGPDHIINGLFRIIKDGKFGFANKNGEIVIEPKYECAFPFEKGVAKVSYDCTSESEGEYVRWHSDSWFFIDTHGHVVESNY